MELVFFDDDHVSGLLPLTLTRPAAALRIGILTIAEKWQNCISANSIAFINAHNYLNSIFPGPISESEKLFINGRVLPNAELLALITNLPVGSAILDKDGTILASKQNKNKPFLDKTSPNSVTFNNQFNQIKRPFDLFRLNDWALKYDFEQLTKGKKSETIDPSVTVIGNRNLVFLEAGATAVACTLNTTDGPIYVGRNAEIMEGCMVRGPFAICEHSTLKMGAKIYGATTVGPHSKVAGEVSNSVILGFSNKAHDGFLGNSVLGEWCNLGADTNNSNLKNNYAMVKLWHYGEQKMVDTGLQFCGLIMGDHSKAGINTMFNTGTVVGVGANIFGGGFPPTFIPSFSWGGADGFEPYRLEKCLEVATQVYQRRALVFGEPEKEMLTKIFEETK